MNSYPFQLQIFKPVSLPVTKTHSPLLLPSSHLPFLVLVNTNNTFDPAPSTVNSPSLAPVGPVFAGCRWAEARGEMSQLYYRRTDSSSYRDRIPLRIVRAESELSPLEKAYLGAVEKGDYASVKQALEVCVCVCPWQNGWCDKYSHWTVQIMDGFWIKALI